MFFFTAAQLISQAINALTPKSCYANRRGSANANFWQEHAAKECILQLQSQLMEVKNKLTYVDLLTCGHANASS